MVTVAALLLVLVAATAVALAVGGTGSRHRSRAASAPVAPPTTHAAGAFTSTGDRAGFAHGYELLYVESDAQIARDLDAMASSGARWLRVDIAWDGIGGAGPGRYDWHTSDRLVLGARARGLSIIGLLSGSPAWAVDGRCEASSCGPRDPAQFAAFARAAAARYTPDGVHVWEIWNEPNHGEFWGPRPDVARYTDLLVQSSRAIKSVDPTAAIVTGGTAPAADQGTDVSPVTFLRGIYDHGGQSAFDAVGHHPYAFPYRPTDAVHGNAFLETRDLYDVMVAHGDGAKRIWGTEVGVPTRGARGVGEADAARWIPEYYDAWNSWAFTGPLLWYTLRDTTRADDESHSYGLLRSDYRPKPSWTAFVRMIERAAPASG